MPVIPSSRRTKRVKNRWCSAADSERESMPRAVVCDAVDAPLRVVELQLAEPQRGEVRVRVVASAVCHSDLLVHDGTLPSPFPMVLGHEAVGVVAQVGADVEGLTVGDHVVVCTMPQCGECDACLADERHLC